MKITAELIYLLLNSLAYISLLCYWIVRYKGINLGIIVLVIFTISSVGSVWFYTYPWTPVMFPNIKPIPLLFLFCMVYICTLPMLKYDVRRITGLYDNGIKNLMYYMAAFFSIMSLLPFIEILFKLSSISLASTFLGQMYESDVDKASYLFSSVGRICFALIRHFGTIPIISLFYIVSIRKTSPLLILGNSICVILLILFTFLSGSRGGVIGQVCAIVFYLFIFKSCLPARVYETIKKSLLIGSGFVVAAFILISVSRAGYGDSYQSSSFTIDRWLSSYLGMGYLYFSDVVWNMRIFADGDQNFALIKSWFGLYNYASPDAYLGYMEGRLGVKLTEFYTNIGDIYCDFGRFGTVVFCVCLYLLQKIFISNKQSKVTFLNIVVMYYVFSFMCYGFAANVYRTIYTQVEMVYPIIIGVIIYLIQKRQPQ